MKKTAFTLAPITLPRKSQASVPTGSLGLYSPRKVEDKSLPTTQSQTIASPRPSHSQRLPAFWRGTPNASSSEKITGSAQSAANTRPDSGSAI